MRRSQRICRRWRAVQWICAAVFALLMLSIGGRILSGASISGEETAATGDMRQLEASVPVAETPQEPSIFGYFDSLLIENPDVVGLVGVGGDSMYVCRGADNQYYMNHRFDGAEDPAGMIFMDCRCEILPVGENILLYGHNMRDGSRFGKLKRYTDAGYLLENPTIRLATLYELYDYVPFAVILTTVDPALPHYFDYTRLSFVGQADFDAFIESARSRSVHDLSVDVRYGDRLLTLVTCSGDGADGRLVILCRRSDAPVATP